MLFLFICMESISLIVLKSLTSEYRNSPPARWQHACFSMTSNSVHSKPIGKSFVCSFMVSCYINQQLHLFLSTTSMWGSFPYTMHFPHSTFPILHLTLSWVSACMYILSKTNYCYLMLVTKMVKRTSVLDYGDVNSNQAFTLS